MTNKRIVKTVLTYNKIIIYKKQFSFISGTLLRNVMEVNKQYEA